MGAFRKWTEENQPIIHFPKEEAPRIKKRVAQGKPIYVTRTEGDFIKGQRVRTAWGTSLEIKDVRTFKDPEKHPFKFKLSEAEREALRKAGSFKVIRLSA